jgi:REP element-mobilizing transposase RayT
MTYLITFTCYGCHLHGSESGSVDREHRIPGTPTLAVDRHRTAADYVRMNQGAYLLDQPRRETVLNAIREVCAYRTWCLHAAHVRSTHVHVIVEADAEPERIMADLKSYASRHLNRAGVDPPDRNRWTKHGSTKWLWKPESLATAIAYVVSEQGAPMSVFEAP